MDNLTRICCPWRAEKNELCDEQTTVVGTTNPALEPDVMLPPVFATPICEDFSPMSPALKYDFTELSKESCVSPYTPFLTKKQILIATDPDIMDATVFRYNRNNLTYISEIGEGWFGKVIRSEATGILPGIKKSFVIVKQLKDCATRSEVACFLAEAQVYRELDHPNILPLYGQSIHSFPYLLIFEHCSKGNLKKYLRNISVDSRRSDETGRLLLKWVFQAASALDFMHMYKIYYGDVATHSCLVDFDLSLKMGDYGLSYVDFKEDYMVVKPSGAYLPIRWMAPELITCFPGKSIDFKNQTPQSNIWSFGVLIWETLMFGQQPFSDLSDETVVVNVHIKRELQLSQLLTRWHFIDGLNELITSATSECSLRPDIKYFKNSLCDMLATFEQDAHNFFEKKWKEADESCTGYVELKSSTVQSSIKDAKANEDIVEAASKLMLDEVVSHGDDDNDDIDANPTSCDEKYNFDPTSLQTTFIGNVWCSDDEISDCEGVYVVDNNEQSTTASN